jgi:hypothetical protein
MHVPMKDRSGCRFEEETEVEKMDFQCGMPRSLVGDWRGAPMGIGILA